MTPFNPALTLEIIALCFSFLLASIFSEDNIRFGYVLVPFLSGFFWSAGLLPFAYLTTIVPLIIFMGIITFLRAHLKYKNGFFGSAGGILYKIVFFLIVIQMAIGFVNGLGIFNGQMASTPNNQYTTYNLTSAQTAFGSNSYGVSIIDQVYNGLNLVWMMFTILWSMIASIFYIYPTLVTAFGIPANISLLIQCGIYIIYGFELVNMVFKPFKPVEV